MTIDSAARVDATPVDERYVLLRRIGQGGMADVFEAEDQVLLRRVAVKMLRNPLASPEDHERFLAEGRILARLTHPGLVAVLDVGSSGGRPFLVIELVEGTTLADRPSGPMPLGDVATLGSQLAKALAYAHATGVVHRDVKPGNVLVDSSGRVLLADFGIASLVGETTGPNENGETVGTAAYLAPEQVLGEEVGPAADVYALGLVLIEAITGERLYTGTPVEAAVARLKTPPRIPDDVPLAWQRLLRQMTVDDPRFRVDAAGVAATLEGLRDARRGVDAEPGEATHAPVASTQRRWGAFAVALAGLLLAIGVVLAQGDIPAPQAEAAAATPSDAPVSGPASWSAQRPSIEPPKVAAQPAPAHHRAGGRGHAKGQAKGHPDHHEAKHHGAKHGHGKKHGHS